MLPLFALLIQIIYSSFQLCHFIKSGTKEHYLTDEKVPFCVNGDEWVGYDNPRSVRLKVSHMSFCLSGYLIQTTRSIVSRLIVII